MQKQFVLGVALLVAIALCIVALPALPAAAHKILEKAALLFLAVLFTLPATLLFMALGSAITRSLPVSSKRFDRALWKYHNARYAMIKDFLCNYELVGMSKNELLGLLGPPDEAENEPTLAWQLGATGGAPGRSLLIHLKDDKVSEFSVDS
ncbi:MAG TPA: hypothetical protein V6C76_13725 [Drouetiella sp.]